MSRIKHESSKPVSNNPTTKYWEWKSNEKTFSYFDKAIAETCKDKEEVKEKANIPVELPTRILVLAELVTIKGWHDASGSGIYSNEVFYVSSEELEVRTFGGKLIAKGLYNDIKAEVKAAGGTYRKSIYAMLDNGEIVNLSIKGSAVKTWSEFTKSLNKGATENFWISIDGAEEHKKGSVPYSTPKFSLGKALTKQEAVSADDAAEALQAHFDGYFKEEVVLEAEIDDDLGI
jgi:hypothetical protein